MTIGWVYEDAYERWGDVQKSPRFRPPPNFVCSLCDAGFQTVAALSKHQTESHRTRIPGFYISAVPVSKDVVIRKRLEASDLALFHCESCWVGINGGPLHRMQTKEFAERFVNVCDEDWVVRLSSEGQSSIENASLEYSVRFRISSEDDLRTVDEAYLATLVRDELEHRDLADFEKRLPAANGARDYGHALSNYALAVMIKDGRTSRGSGVSREEYAAKMRCALAVLSSIKRSVADLVCFAIRLNLNDFGGNTMPVGTSLESAFRLFNVAAGHAVLEAPLPRRVQSVAACPLDSITGTMASACEELARGQHVAEGLERLLRDVPEMSPLDKVKVSVICAVDFAARQSSRAVDHLRFIEYNHTFAGWAANRLARESTAP
jgi:hypothetical protein